MRYIGEQTFVYLSLHKHKPTAILHKMINCMNWLLSQSSCIGEASDYKSRVDICPRVKIPVKTPAPRLGVWCSGMIHSLGCPDFMSEQPIQVKATEHYCNSRGKCLYPCHPCGYVHLVKKITLSPMAMPGFSTSSCPCSPFLLIVDFERRCHCTHWWGPCHSGDRARWSWFLALGLFRC